LICNQQVVGSNPTAGSTQKARKTAVLLGFFAFMACASDYGWFIGWHSKALISRLKSNQKVIMPGGK
jgi:hypothetical protein